MNLQMRSKTSSGAANFVIIYIKLLLTTLFWSGAFVAGRKVKGLDHFAVAFLRFGVAQILI